MTIAVNTMTVAKADPPGQTLFTVSAYTATPHLEEELKSAPEATEAIYITRCHVALNGDGILDIGSGVGAFVVETIAFQLLGTAEGIVYDIKFEHPIKLEDGKSLNIDGTADMITTLLIEGFVS